MPPPRRWVLSNSKSSFGPATDSKWNFLKLKDGTLYRDTANPNGVRFDQGIAGGCDHHGIDDEWNVRIAGDDASDPFDVCR